MTPEITIEEAASRYGVPVETIRAFVRRDYLHDPIGSETHVYDDDKLARLVAKYQRGQQMKVQR